MANVSSSTTSSSKGRPSKLVILREQDLLLPIEQLEPRLKRAADNGLRIVLAEKTKTSESFFYNVQMVAATKYGVSMIPVHDFVDMAQEAKEVLNRDLQPPDSLMSDFSEERFLASLSTLPGVGPSNGKRILDGVGSFEALVELSERDFRLFCPDVSLSVRKHVLEAFDEPLLPQQEDLPPTVQPSRSAPPPRPCYLPQE